jgi:DNA mismatch repair protein MutL
VARSIRILDDDVVDKIAAGEVVERPASIVKELLENAIDAEASSVTVEIQGGGIALVRVTDDGIGIAPAEAELALKRHATSKLSSAADLFSIGTLGFRGEALPSIAAVSRFALTTRTRDQTAGVRIVCAGGSAIERAEVGCAAGTSVEVKDLFFNVPARRKFLKSQSTESGHVTSVCLRTALVFPGLRVVLVRDGRQVLEYLPVRSFIERVMSAFVDEKLVPVEIEAGDMQISAALGAPERARSGAGNLHLFVNRRPVRDTALARAVLYAYGSVLPPGRYPVGALHLQLDPSAVDVNVHPQKLEVRFAETRTVLDAVTRSLAKALGTSAWSGPAARGPAYWSQRLSGLSATSVADSGGAPFSRNSALDNLVGAFAQQPAEADPWGLSGGPSASEYKESQAQSASAYPRVAETASEPILKQCSSEPMPPKQQELLATARFYGSLRVLGQVRRVYLVCEGADALYVIDQHAADERLKFDRLRKAFLARHVEVQRLLIPERMECSPDEMALIEEHHDDLCAAGLDCEPMGETTVVIRSIPALLGRAAPERLLRDLLTQLDRKGERAFDSALDRGLATMACHAAVRSGDVLSMEQAAALLQALDEVSDFTSYCPHGRPIVFTIGFDELQRRLGR